MIRINLKERIQVVKPFDRVNFGGFVATKEDLFRRKLLVESFNRISAYLRRHFDFVDQFVSHESLQKALDLSHPALRRFIKTGRLRAEDINLHLFRRRQPHEGINELIRILNSACAFEEIEGNSIEFYMADIPNFPGSVIRMRKGGDPSLALMEDPDQVKRNFKSLVLLSFDHRHIFSQSKVYTEEQIRNIYVKHYGPANIQTIRELLLLEDHSFHPVLRPKRLDNAGRLYVVGSVKHKQSGTVPILVSENRGYRAVALKSEIDELRREGRVVIVEDEKNKFIYLTQLALAEGLERGSIREIAPGGRYITVGLIFTYKLERAYRPEEIKPKPARVFLEYYHNKQLSEDYKGYYPFLTAAIDMLRASPAGTEEIFEAAKAAADQNVSEDDLIALLLFKYYKSEEHYRERGRHWYLNSSRTYRCQDFLFEIMRELGLSMVDCMLKIEKIASTISFLEKMNSINIGKTEPKESRDVAAFLKMFVNSLSPINSKDGQIIYFAQVLAKLRHTSVNGLSAEDEKHLRIVVATMAERCGHSKFAAEIRDELFRITHNREYRKMRAAIERAFGLKYPEMEAHVQKTADLIREVLVAVGIHPDQYKLYARVKLPYSSWEKMESLLIKNPGLLKDVLGLSLIVKDDAEAYRVMDLLRQAFTGVYRKSAKGPQRIAVYLKKTGVGEFVDQIQDPRKSGFSALFYHCRTDLGLPIEIQVTSEKRQKVNKGGNAAHWKHKIRREVKASYGIEMEEIE